MARGSRRYSLHARASRSDFALEPDERPERGGGGGLFAWTVILLLLVGFAIACWIFSFYIFNHPERAASYSILTKLKKLDPPKRFEITDAPRGEFLKVEDLWARYNVMSDRELQRASEALLRNYIRNFKFTQDLVPYVVGDFIVLDSFELTGKNLFTEGVLVVAQSKKIPQLLIEHVFPNQGKYVAEMQRALLSGREYNIHKNNELAAVLNVRRLSDQRLLFTTVPILYGDYAPSDMPGLFSTEPPELLNVEAGLPVASFGSVTEADQRFVTQQQKAGEPAAVAPKPPAQLVRVQRPKTAAGAQAPPKPKPEPTVLPAIPVSTPEVIATGTVAAPITTPPPFATPAPQPDGADGWPTYPPGQMPPGRLMDVTNVGGLAGNGRLKENYYLYGDFVVNASGNNIAVLRLQPSAADRLGLGKNMSNIRIIVTYPSGRKPPALGATFSRDSRRPFAVQEVRRTTGDEVNVYAREVTHAE